MKKINLSKRELNKIQDILIKFPNIEHFELNEESHCGLGSVLNISFMNTVNGVLGEFSIEISGEETW
jgi:hypothetical protein